MIFGYQSKLVRDNIHGSSEDPRCGKVCTIGGGRTNRALILEAFGRVVALSCSLSIWIRLG